jgi:ElaB/YqjD/DUF883 family membrane-anchored ribosome-binding protein
MATVSDQVRNAERKVERTMYGNQPASETGERVADMAEQAGAAAQEQLDRLADMIRRKPVQAAGIAAGIGFVLALLARR